MKKIYSKNNVYAHFSFLESGYLWICCIGIFLFVFPSRVSATHVVGSDITYKCTGTPGIYEITLVVYRKCDGGSATLCPNICGASCVLDNANALKVLGADPGCSTTTFASVPLTDDHARISLRMSEERNPEIVECVIHNMATF